MHTQMYEIAAPVKVAYTAVPAVTLSTLPQAPEYVTYQGTQLPIYTEAFLRTWTFEQLQGYATLLHSTIGRHIIVQPIPATYELIIVWILMVQTTYLVPLRIPMSTFTLSTLPQAPEYVTYQGTQLPIYTEAYLRTWTFEQLHGYAILLHATIGRQIIVQPIPATYELIIVWIDGAKTTYLVPLRIPMSTFDLIDRNHDGVITRQEWNQSVVTVSGV